MGTKWALNRLQLVTTFLRRRDDTFVAFPFFFLFSFWTRRDDAMLLGKEGEKESGFLK
jgi:hypothetical protein